MNYDIDTEEGMANAVAWTRDTFSQLKEGGIWYVPRSLTSLQISHLRREVTIVSQVFPDPAINQVVQAMGWTIKEQA